MRVRMHTYPVEPGREMWLRPGRTEVLGGSAALTSQLWHHKFSVPCHVHLSCKGNGLTCTPRLAHASTRAMPAVGSWRQWVWEAQCRVLGSHRAPGVAFYPRAEDDLCTR